jgi:hypothetical protein
MSSKIIAIEGDLSCGATISFKRLVFVGIFTGRDSSDADKVSLHAHCVGFSVCFFPTIAPAGTNPYFPLRGET